MTRNLDVNVLFVPEFNYPMQIGIPELMRAVLGVTILLYCARLSPLIALGH